MRLSDRKPWWRLAGVVLALIVPACALFAASRAAGSFVAPFGWAQIALAHLLATWPLSLATAAALRRSTRETFPLVEAFLCVMLGVGVAAMTVAWGAEFGAALGPEKATFAARLLVRVAWCLLLQLPWCLLGRCLGGRTESLLRLPGWVTAGLALVVAVALPAVYTTSLVAEQTRLVDESIGRGRLVKARQLTVGWDDLTLPPAVARQVANLEAAVAQPLPPNAAPESVVRRAGMLAALDRLDEARRLLQPLADAGPEASLLLAAIDQDLKRTAESNERYRAVLRLLDGMPESDQAKLWRVDAYDGLAFNAREQQDFAGAIAVYREALAAVPGAEAYYHFQLGRQLHQAGRSGEALEHLDEASRLDSATYAGPASPLVNNIRTHTTGCFLHWVR